MTYKEKYSAYSTASHMVRKTKQVVMLYDGAISAVQRAKSAIKEGRIEDRFNSLVKACDIITGLQLSLDFERGGDVAKTLYDYYAGIDMRLMSIHQSESTDMCDMCITHLKMMRSAWDEIDNSHNDVDGNKAVEVDLSNPKLSKPISDMMDNISLMA